MMLGNFITITKPSFAAISIVERPEDDLLILELYVNDSLRNPGFLTYLPRDYDVSQMLVPLRALAREMSVAITVNPADGVAEGFYIDESRRFQLDLEAQNVLNNGQKSALSEGHAESHYGDIYVQAKALEDWFGLKIRTDITTLRVFITTEDTLPFEAQLEREKRAEANKDQALSKQPSYTPGSFIPYKNFTRPSIVLQDSISARRSDSGNIFQNSFSIQSNNDLAGLGTRFLLSGTTSNETGSEFDNAQLTFRKRSPEQNLLGPLQAGSIAFGDVDYPDVPLFSGRKRGAGVFIASSSQLSVSRSFGTETTLIDGDAPIGWDAELYRNGYFVDFQSVGDNGRYSFEDVELLNGFNLFRIELYGPEGQQETVTQRIVRGGKLLKKGEVNYEFAAGTPDADFLPITEDRRTDREFGASGQVFYGVRENLTLGASVFNGTDNTSSIESSQTAATVSAVFPFLGFRNQLRYLRATDNRSGYQFESTTRVAGANLSFSHTGYSGFDDDDEDIERSTSLSVNRNFGPFSGSLEVERRSFIDEQEDETEIRSRLSTRFAGLQISNTLERTLSSNEAQENFDGELAVVTDVQDWRLRGSALYDLESDAQQRLQSLRLSAFKNLNKESSLRLNADHDFNSEITRTEARYSRQFDKFSLDVNAGGDSEQNYFGGVSVRTALQPGPDGNYELVNAKDGSLGSVGLRAFVDMNNNGVFDIEEEPIEGIEFRSNQGKIDGQTSSDGLMFIRGLGETITRFSLQDSSLPSIYLKPGVDYVDIIPRIGATRTIDVPFHQLGEIDGFIYRGEPDENGDPVGAAGIVVILADADTGEEIESTLSEYDGFYIFSGLELGRYKVMTEPGWTEDPATLPSYSVTLDAQNNILTDQNLTLPAIVIEPEITEEADLAAEISPQEPVPSEKPYLLQLGSFKRLQQAEKEKSRIEAIGHPSLLDIVIRIMPAEVKNAIYHRVVGGLDRAKDGKRICPQLVADRVVKGCITINNQK